MTEATKTPNQKTDETADSKASHTALIAIAPQLRAWAQAHVDYGRGIVDENNEDQASERVSEAYARVYTGQGGDACHQGWECDLGPAMDWWMTHASASDEEWLAELGTWCWVDEDGNTHDRTPQEQPKRVLWIARLHQSGSDWGDDMDATGNTEDEARGQVIGEWLEANDQDPRDGDAQDAVEQDLEEGNIAIETRSYTID